MEKQESKSPEMFASRGFSPKRCDMSGRRSPVHGLGLVQPHLREQLGVSRCGTLCLLRIGSFEQSQCPNHSTTVTKIKKKDKQTCEPKNVFYCKCL